MGPELVDAATLWGSLGPGARPNGFLCRAGTNPLGHEKNCFPGFFKGHPWIGEHGNSYRIYGCLFHT